MLGRPIGEVDFVGDQTLHRTETRRQDADIAHGVERPADGAKRVFDSVFFGHKVDHARVGKIPGVRKIGAFAVINGLDHLGDQKIEVRIALTVGMADHIDGDAVNTDGHVSTMVIIKTAQEVLHGLAAPGVLAGHKSGQVIQHLPGRVMRPDGKVFFAHPSFGGRADRPALSDSNQRQPCRWPGRELGFLLADSVVAVAYIRHPQQPNDTAHPTGQTAQGKALFFRYHVVVRFLHGECQISCSPASFVS